VFVILDLHRALNCALVAALLGRPGLALSASSSEQAGSRILRQAVHRWQRHVLPFLRLLEKAQRRGTT
jgi:hypothetical protein